MKYEKARRALLATSAGILTMSLFLTLDTVANPPSVIAPVPDSAFRRVQILPSAAPAVAEQTALPRVVAPLETALPLETRPPLSVPPAPVQQEPRVSPRPTVDQTPIRASDSLLGKASWYCNYDDPQYDRSVCHYKYPDGPGSDMYAAACGKLRRAMGSDWRGQRVTVRGNGYTIVVRLVDWCGSEDKTIDLYRDAMDRLNGGGVVTVRVSW
jgi:hypothetical protein